MVGGGGWLLELRILARGCVDNIGGMISPISHARNILEYLLKPWIPTPVDVPIRKL